MNGMTDERLTRLRAACSDDSPIDADQQAAIVALSLTRLQLERNFSDRDLSGTKERLGELVADLMFPGEARP